MAISYGFEIDLEGLIIGSDETGLNDGVYSQLGSGFEITVDTLIDIAPNAIGVFVGNISKLGDGFIIDVDNLVDMSDFRGVVPPVILKAVGNGAPLDLQGKVWDPDDDMYEVLFNYTLVDFWGAPRRGRLGLIVYFKSMSVFSTVDSYLWDFGDGNTSTDEDPIHEYNTAGFKTVSLQIMHSSEYYTETKIAYIEVILADLYLVKNGSNGNSIENSIVVSYKDSDLDFATASTTIGDMVYNLMTYNYGAGNLNIVNPVSNVIASQPNTDPLFTEAELIEQLFNIDEVMENTFLPRNESPVLNKGDNQFVSDIPDDIIGNSRRYLFGIVDIGPYELQIHQLVFTAGIIKSISQDKLRIDYNNQRFIPVKTDDIYNNLWNQFIDNPNHKEEFVRESKVLIKLKVLTTDLKFSTDKNNIELARFEAYFDRTSKTIVFTKTDESVGSMLSHLFDDGRYTFYFDEIAHLFVIYLNPTYNMGKSGKKNIVNEVRVGGPAIVNG